MINWLQLHKRPGAPLGPDDEAINGPFGLMSNGKARFQFSDLKGFGTLCSGKVAKAVSQGVLTMSEFSVFTVLALLWTLNVFKEKQKNSQTGLFSEARWHQDVFSVVE